MATGVPILDNLLKEPNKERLLIHQNEEHKKFYTEMLAENEKIISEILEGKNFKSLPPENQVSVLKSLYFTVIKREAYEAASSHVYFLKYCKEKARKKLEVLRAQKLGGKNGLHAI